MDEIGEELDAAIAREVFGVTQAVIDAWPWPVPEFSTDRRWAAAVAEKMLFSPDWREPFDCKLHAAAKVAGWESAEQFSGLATLLTVLTPDVICQSALKTVRECGDAKPI
ncbi:MAG: hypothetical protein PHQ05_13170 [Sterolibacterium sp.]|nr:hypothetical protein [Sterolibacterium sp.]